MSYVQDQKCFFDLNGANKYIHCCHHRNTASTKFAAEPFGALFPILTLHLYPIGMRSSIK